MKMTYIVLAVLILIGLLFAFLYKKKNEVKGNGNISAQNSQDTTRPRETKLDENPYEGLKRLAYSTQYNQLNLPTAGDNEILYGTIMDWDYEGKAIITLVSFKTGDVSLYFSTGAAIIGVGQHDNIKQAGKEFIQKAETLLPSANNVDTALTSESGVVKFYLMTNKGKYTIKDKVANIYNHTSQLSNMFDDANKIITLIRMTEEKMEQNNKTN